MAFSFLYENSKHCVSKTPHLVIEPRNFILAYKRLTYKPLKWHPMLLISNFNLQYELAMKDITRWWCFLWQLFTVFIPTLISQHGTFVLAVVYRVSLTCPIHPSRWKFKQHQPICHFTYYSKLNFNWLDDSTICWQFLGDMWSNTNKLSVSPTFENSVSHSVGNEDQSSTQRLHFLIDKQTTHLGYANVLCWYRNI